MSQRPWHATKVVDRRPVPLCMLCSPVAAFGSPDSTRGSLSANLQRIGLAIGSLTHVIANATRPAHRRGHITALLAILLPARRGTGVP